jgi:RNA-directed DNA polymerase
MKRYGNIYSKIYDLNNLSRAFDEAAKDKHYYKEIKKLLPKKDLVILKIHEMLKNQTYKILPTSYKQKIIHEGNKGGKERELMKLKFYPHRIVQWAMILQIRDYLLKSFCYHSCSSVPNGGIARAHKLVTSYLKDEEGTQYCLKIDVKKFYPNIDKEILKEKLKLKFKDEKLLWLLFTIIDSFPKNKGVPIGALFSQYAANFYLTDYDHFVKEELGEKYVVRYMDDIIFLNKSKSHLRKVLEITKKYWKENLNLDMKGNYQIFPVEKRGIDFVGFVFRHNSIRLRKSSELKIRKISNTIQKHQKLTERQFYAINSIVGYFQYYDSAPIYKQYILPIEHLVFEYYIEKIVGHLKEKDPALFLKRIENYLKNLQSKFKSTENDYKELDGMKLLMFYNSFKKIKFECFETS